MVRHKKVGFEIEEPAFNRGQLYVAATNVGEPQDHYFAARKSVRRKTRNVVHKEII